MANSDSFVAGAECRADIGSRTISGVAIRYGEVSPSHREMFAGPGSIRVHSDAWLDYGHDREKVLCWQGAGLEFIDTAEELRFVATIPRTIIGERALDDVHAGRKNAISVEFNPISERRDFQTGVRVIESSFLQGLGLVEAPSYPSSVVTEIRQGGILEGTVKLEADIPCRCRQNCETALFKKDSLDKALGEAAAGKREITSFFSGAYDSPISSTGRGLSIEREGNIVRVRMPLPDTAAAREFEETHQNAFHAIRLWVPAGSTAGFSKVGTRAIFGRGTDLRGIEVAPITGDSTNFDPVVLLALLAAIDEEEEDELEERQVPTLAIISIDDLASDIGILAGRDTAKLTRLRNAVSAIVENRAALAPEPVKNQAITQAVAYIYDAPDYQGSVSNAMRNSGALALLHHWIQRGAVVARATGSTTITGSTENGGPGVDATARASITAEALTREAADVALDARIDGVGVGGGGDVADVVDGRLPADPEVMRLGWSQTLPFVAADFTRADNPIR